MSNRLLFSLLFGWENGQVQAGLRGIRTLLTLTDNWDHYGGIDWYLPWSSTAYSHNDFFTDYTIKDIYKAYFYNLATRVNTYTGVEYRNDPRIFCWELINEPRLSGWRGGKEQNNDKKTNEKGL